MANTKIMLKAEANRLGIEGYRTMGEDELKSAIASAKGASSPKGKTSTATNGSAPAKGKGKSPAAPAKGKAQTAPAKGKGSASTSSPAKSAQRKSSGAKRSTAARGTAKRTTAAAGKGKTGTAAKRSTAKRTTARSTPRPATTERRRKAPRVDIDRTKIDWKRDTNIGQTGQSDKRAIVMAELRKRNGNYDKVYEAVEGYALKWYPNALNSYPTAPTKKHAAQRMVRWLIGRVALDYVKATGQHVSGTRAGYGESQEPADIRRRANREEARKAREKAEKAAKRGKGK